MRKVDIRSKCRVNSNCEKDTFVGLRCSDGDISINFPIGYHISEDDNELRKDIMLLFTTLSANTKRKESDVLRQGNAFDEMEFPLQSYLYLIKDFFARGYYKEQEVSYKVAKKGKINWNRTIKTQKSYVQGTDVFYLDFVTKNDRVKENELITLIHEYCVYESFEQMGWLFTRIMPEKPRIIKRDRIFRSVLKEKLANTYNDKNRILFRHMLAIIDFEGDRNSDKTYRYGTYRFEYVWEKMIDKVFGIENKADYFPKTSWWIDKTKHENASLEPDTIMISGTNVYILDAKYYKYGVTGNTRDLPESTSINKQITYGEYVANIPCKHPGCAALIPHGQMYCEEHKPLHTKDRAHAAERGYGAKWQRERRKFLESNPFCVKCYEEGHITMATVVDHIKPHRGDQKLFWDRSNWQPLCEHHHNVKTMTEDRFKEYRF